MLLYFVVIYWKIENILWNATVSSLLFSARVVTDRVSGYSKGFGFVQYATIEEAAKGIEGMDGKVIEIKP